MSDDDTAVVSGCHNLCEGNSSQWCQISLPAYLQLYKVDYDTLDNSAVENGGGDECKLAFIVKTKWFESNLPNHTDMLIRKYVPAILGWSLSFESKISKRKPYYCDNSTNGFQCYYKDGFEGNAYLKNGCQGLGSSLGLLLLLCSFWCLYRFVKKRRDIKRKQKFFKRNGGLLLEQQVCSNKGNLETMKLYNSKELNTATDNFSKDRILGHGGQGTVYKGMLADGRIVAVKKSKIVDEENLEQFINEVVILSQINHRNIVKLLGCCLETEVPLLVYEFILNGTLSDYIHEQNEEFKVPWEMRLQIATEVAGALSYLHSAAAIPIYHRDIKSTNILLDEKYKAKVSDFGTSRSIAVEQTHLTTVVSGTFGYLDPEYFQSSQFTDKSDVYSFGVVLVELLTGQRAISCMRPEEGRSLATYFIMSMELKYQFDIFDVQVMKQGGKEVVMAVAELAQRCLNLNGRNRPTMKQVAMKLEGIRMSGKDGYNHEEAEIERSVSETNEPSSHRVSTLKSDGSSGSSLAMYTDVQPLIPSYTW